MVVTRKMYIIMNLCLKIYKKMGGWNGIKNAI